MKIQSPIWLRGIFFLAILPGLLFLAAPAFAAPDPDSCVTNKESRQFDFWLGEWNIAYPGAPGGSASKVYLDLDKCLIIESWDGGEGHMGKNIFAYSSNDKSWRGMFADNRGRVHVFEGKVAQDSAEFFGPSRGPNGETVLNRLKVVRLAPDKVEQTWEKSSDNGATWTSLFRLEYSRKKS
jgi:hypothetical protein